ncbi:hypothetical protein N9458_03095 [Gammaproteobacteria bacterium]|nr:hypothetical protein [Gammaproteobacteria bacterium]
MYQSKKFSFLKNPVAFLFVIAACFPWVSFGTNEMDMQPWAFIIGALYLLYIKRIDISPNYIEAFSIMLVGLFITILVSNSYGFLAFRAIYNFISIFLFYSIFLGLFRKYDLVKVFITVSYVWFVGAFIELIDPSIMEIFGKIRTSDDRGVTSFAPEPSFYGANIIFLSILIIVLSDFNFKKNKNLLIINMVSLVALAKSPIGISYLLVICFVIVLFHLLRLRPTKTGIKLFFIFLLLTFSTIFLYFTLDIDNRIFYLLGKVLTGAPLELFRLDASINERLAHIVFSIYGSFSNFLLPNGIDTFSETRILLEPEFNDYFWYSMNTDKIMSWYGDWLFTLGIFGFLSLFLLLRPIILGDRRMVWTFIGISIILLSAIPLAYPIVPALFAALQSRRYRQ